MVSMYIIESAMSSSVLITSMKNKKEFYSDHKYHTMTYSQGCKGNKGTVWFRFFQKPQVNIFASARWCRHIGIRLDVNNIHVARLISD